MAGEAHWKPHLGKESILPRQPCFAPRTAAAPPTTGGSGRGCRDLKAVNKGNRSKRPGGEGGWGRGGGSLPKPAAEDCQPCPHTPRTHTPPHTQKQKDRGAHPGRNCCCDLPHQPSHTCRRKSDHMAGPPRPPSSLTALSSRALPAPTLSPLSYSRCQVQALRSPLAVS